ETELGGEAVGRHQGREAGAEVDRGVAVGRQEVGVPPDRERSGGDLLAAGGGGDRLVVVGHFEWAEAPLAGGDRGALVVAARLPTSQSVHVCHGSCPPSSAGRCRRFLDALSSASSGGTALWLTHRSGIGTWLPGPASRGSGWLVAAASSGLSLGRS